MTVRADRPRIRSRLYVPGTKTEWIEKASSAGVDAVIFDLEDAVADTDKEHARTAVTAAVASGREHPLIFVRVNEMSSPLALDDLEAVVRPGLFGVVVPKVTSTSEITALDLILSWLEARSDMQPGSVVVSPILETAAAIHLAYELAGASPRVDYTGGIATRGGDVERAIGYRWSPSGAESLAMRAATLVALRAAGVRNPITGIWTELDDPDGLAGFARQGRDLGYVGMDTIHPSHVGTVNSTFAPDEDSLREARAIVAAARDGSATRQDGRMVDRAMLRTAEALLRQAPDRP
jgi:citrate lyase subunit beta / citryl-CoA lyase